MSVLFFVYCHSDFDFAIDVLAALFHGQMLFNRPMKVRMVSDFGCFIGACIHDDPLP